MAYEESLVKITMDADASLGVFTGVAGLPGGPVNPGGLQYRFVKPVGEHSVGLSTLATDSAIGVLQNKPQGVGHAATVAIHGVSMVEAGAAVAAGATVAGDTSGRAVANAANIRGVAIHSAAAAGELIPVLLRLN